MSKVPVSIEGYDVAVLGAGSAGVAAAIAAAKNGAKTILIESSAALGGDLLSGLPIDGCRSSNGEWIVGGVAQELFEECGKWDGYIGSIYDRRNICIVMVNPNVMGLAVLRKLDEYGVKIMPYTQVVGAQCCEGRIEKLHLINKTQAYELKAKYYLDCTGDADVATMCGVPYEMGDEDGELQPATVVFHFRNVDPQKLLGFMLEHPENCGLGENPLVPKTAKELAQELYDLGYPKAFFSSKGPLMREAIANGELHSCSMLAVTPNSLDGTCVTINATRMVLPDCTDALILGDAILELTRQVENAVEFIKKRIPGFENAEFSGIAPRLGIRESRRIIGEYTLTGEDVKEARKRADGVCKGGHEVDIHGRAENHVRFTIKDAGSYDIPLGCMLPVGVSNLMVAGRSLSADRVAHSSARVMGTCMAMGQAVGTAAALSVQQGVNPRALSTDELRCTLKRQGAILDGTK